MNAEKVWYSIGVIYYFLNCYLKLKALQDLTRSCLPYLSLDFTFLPPAYTHHASSYNRDLSNTFPPICLHNCFQLDCLSSPVKTYSSFYAPPEMLSYFLKSFPILFTSMKMSIFSVGSKHSKGVPPQ